MGLFNKNTQKILLLESNLTIERAIQISCTHEAAMKNLVQAKYEPDNHGAVCSIKTSNRKFSKASTSFNKGVKQSQGHPGDGFKIEKPCYRCTGKHLANNCPHRMAKCYHCGKQGHISMACMAKKARGNRIRSHANVI